MQKAELADAPGASPPDAPVPAEGGVVLGLDFGGSKIAAGLCDLDGALIAKSITETEPARGAEENLERGLRLGWELLSKACIGADPDSGESGRLMAVGACTFGIPLEHGVKLSPAVPGWEKLPLKHCVEDAFQVATAVVNDVKAAAGAELRHGALAGADPGLYLNLGTGLAAAVVVGGEVLSGHHGASGEIGYSLRRPIDVLARRAVGAPDHKPVLEDLVSGMGLASAASRLQGGDPAAPAAEVFERAATDPEYRQLIEEFSKELCFHVVNLAIALDPERIVVGGGMARSWDVIEGPLRAALEAHVPYPPELALGTFPYDAALHGAIDLALELANSRSTRTDSRPEPD